MNIFEQISHNIINVRDNVDLILVRSMGDNEHVILDLQRDQIEHGLGSDGVSLGEYAIPEYAAAKQAMGSKAPPGIYDFKLSGSFLDGLYSEMYFGSNAESSGLYISSRDQKTDKLESLPGLMAPIWGITDENKPEVQEIILLTALTEIKDEIIRY